MTRRIKQALLVLALCAASCGALAANGNYWFAQYRSLLTSSSADGLCKALIATINADPQSNWRGRGVLDRTVAYPQADSAQCWLTYESQMEIFGWTPGPLGIRRDRARCSDGFTLQADGSCAPNRQPERSCAVGHPVFPAVGTKTLIEQDDAGNQELPLTRSYRSYLPVGVASGAGSWAFNWQRYLDVSASTYPEGAQVIAIREDGATHTFAKTSNKWVANSTRDVLQSVVGANGVITGWQYTSERSGDLETYDSNGALQSVRTRGGRVTTLAYNNKKQLIRVTVPSGRSLIFGYDVQNRISSITAPDGAITKYAYNATGMLTTVAWPDNTTRQYVYEDTRFPTALTGVIDEAGVRYATYAYDDQGRAITSELTAGADRYQFQYQANGQTTVLTPDGGSSVYSFLKQNGVLLPTGVSAPCPTCGNTALSTSYDSNNNATSKTGYDGSTTSYTYDTLGRETQRIEGAGTVNAKTITTEWHPTLDLPAKVASAGKLETFAYDGAGNLVSYTTVATTDASGAAGLNATPTGDVTKTDWTFDSAGRVVAATEAIGGTTTGTWALTYDAQGNVQTFTDPDGRTANAVSYDAAGRLQEAINTDGERTKYRYNARGLLTAYDVDGAVVNYDYDANGLLTAIRGPGDYYFGFKYDAAHRLIALLTPAGQAALASTANPIQAARLAMTAEAQRTAKLSLVERLWIKAKSWLAKLLSLVVGEATANPALVETAVAPPIPAQVGGGMGGVSSGNRDLDELIGTSRPMLGADALLSEFNKSVRKIGNILGVTQSSSETCEDDSRCESAKQKAVSIYHNLTAKRFPQYLSGGTRGSDKTHYETIKAKQSGLRDAIRRVRLYCRPLPAELPEWERVANQDVPILF